MKVIVNFRVDKEVRDESREIFESIGIDMSTALNIFLKQVIKDREIPFRLKADNIDVEENLLDEYLNKKIKVFEEKFARGEIETIDAKLILQETKDKYGLK